MSPREYHYSVHSRQNKYRCRVTKYALYDNVLFGESKSKFDWSHFGGMPSHVLMRNGIALTPSS